MRELCTALAGVLLMVGLMVTPLGAEELEAGSSSTVPAPIWKLDLGLSYLATSGNSDAESLGLDGRYVHDWEIWGLEAGFDGLRASDDGETTAESVTALVRGRRHLSERLALTAAVSGLQDEFAGVDLRTVTDLALEWQIVETEHWELAELAGPTWVHEDLVDLPSDSWLGGIAQLQVGWTPSETAAVSARLSYFPNFDESDDHRLEGELAAQAAVDDRLALRFGHLWRRDNLPAPGFETTDRRTTASLVLHWGGEEAE